jgi:hypothetical protein
LCSTASNLTSHCTLASPGIGIYAAGVGGLLTLIGGWQIYKSDALEAEVDENREPASPASPIRAWTAPTIADRLRTLDQLRDDNLITDAEHSARRAALLEEI